MGRNSRTHLDGAGVCQHHPQSCLWPQLHGFPLLQQIWSLHLQAHLCHAEQQPYLKEAKIIKKSVVCISKIKLLHFFHPFASHFPGNSTAPQAAACHGWLMRLIQQQGAIFMGIHDFLNVTAFASQPALRNRDFLKVSGLAPFSEQPHKKPWRHFHSVLGVGFWTDAQQKKEGILKGIEREIGHEEYRRCVCKTCRNNRNTRDECWQWWQITVILITFHRDV